MGNRFYLRPKWLIGHVIVFVLVALMVSLGLWQLDRLDQRKATNTAIRAAQTSPVRDVGIVDEFNQAPEFGRVRLKGTWDERGTVLVRSSFVNQQPGYFELAPFRLADGDGKTISVLRDWIPFGDGRNKSQMAESVDSPIVTIEGRRRIGRDRKVNVRENTGTPPIETVDHIVGPYLHLTAGAATDAVLVPLPELTEGSHFSYALQWFAFSTIAIVGWIILLRRGAQDE